MTSLREQVKKLAKDQGELNPEEVRFPQHFYNKICVQFSNLILDSIQIDRLTVEDKKYLEEFKNLELLSMNDTKIKSTENFPDGLTIVRVR